MHANSQGKESAKSEHNTEDPETKPIKDKEDKEPEVKSSIFNKKEATKYVLDKVK